MSDMDSLLMNAVVVDVNTDEVCALVVGYERTGHKMQIKVVLDDEYFGEDGDDPEKEDIPEEEPEVKTKAKGKSINEKIAELKVANE